MALPIKNLFKLSYINFVFISLSSLLALSSPSLIFSAYPAPSISVDNHVNTYFSPKPYSELLELPLTVSVSFHQTLNTSTGELILLDPTGKNLINAPALASQSISAQPEPPLYSGKYLILFAVLTSDGSTLTGSSSFTLLPSANYSPAPDSLRKDSNPSANTNLTTLDYTSNKNLFLLSLTLLPISFSLFIYVNRRYLFKIRATRSHGK